MEELKDLIIKYFEKNKKYHTIDQLKKELKIKGEERNNIFIETLNTLVENGYLFCDDKKGYRIFTNDIGMAYGEIEINKSGNGFIHTRDGYTIFIKNSDLNGALNGDKVIIDSIDFGRKNDFQGSVHKILKRKNGKVIFEVIDTGFSKQLIPYNKYESLNIYVDNNQMKNLVDGDLVLISVGTEHFENEYKGQIEKIIGHKTDPDIDIKLLAEKYNIPIEFSPEALEEAKNIPTEVSEEEILDRVDLRNKNIVTIDCDDTKDRDDAILVEKLENGNYRLITSISAVNYYIKRGSKLFDEALERNTSHYPNNTCIPLFPHSISNGICSLNPNVDRLTKTVETEITPEGKIVDTKIYKSVINSKKAMKYSEVNEVLEGKEVKGYENFINDLKLMEELSNAYESARNKRNCIDFDIPDIKVIQDDSGNVINLKPSGMGRAEKIIENCMLITNTAIANYYSWMPFIYRIHEYPNETTVKNTLDILRESGFNFPKINSVNEKSIKGILEKIKSKEEMDIVRELLLKSMKRARYDTTNMGHFALQLDKYCHFTSPIRRISDFMIHTIIDEIETMSFDEENISNLEKELSLVSENASRAEKTDKDMEDEAVAMAMAEYMEKHIGEEFEARITQISQNGLFVKTNNMISGKIRFDDLKDDYYYFDYDKKAVIGKKTKNKYQIGNKLFVIAKEASKVNRTIYFEQSKQKSLRIS